MQKIKVACTSSSGLSPTFLASYGIDFIPILAEFQGKEYREGIDITPIEFFNQLEQSAPDRFNLPKTHMPTTESIQKVFENAVKERYTDIVIITISSGLGGTCAKIKIVAEDYNDLIQIHIFDSKITGLHEGILAIIATQMAKAGSNTKEIIQSLFSIRANSFLFGACSNLEYLIYNGRLKGAQAFLGKTLNIYPSLEMNNSGEIISFKKSFHLNKSFLYAGERILESLKDCENYLMWRLSTGNKVVKILEKVEDKLGLVPNLPHQTMSLSAGVHTGPHLGGWGLIKFENC